MPKIRIKNASILPKIYYVLHMVEGVAHYKPAGEQEYTIFVSENTAKKMNPSFAGRPVYVDHVDEVDLTNLEIEADGYVVESFFNTPDGKNWAKILVVTDKGHEAIRSGWRVSNAYIVNDYGPGGCWHGVDYSKEVMLAEYEHLAIVDSPRYDESKVFTPDQFKEYNLEKEKEIERLSNSLIPQREIKKMKLNIFKRAKVENKDDINFDELMIALPRTGREVSIQKLINMADEEKSDHANGDDKIKVGDKEMSVNELVEKYENMVKKKNEDDEKAKENEEKEKEENEAIEKEKENEGDDDKPENEKDHEKEENSINNEIEKAEKALEVARKKSSNYNQIINAASSEKNNVESYELSEDKLARGKAKYGS